MLARLPQPLALLEVGAAAGLCLLPDQYGYDYGRVRLLPESATSSAPPAFQCAANTSTPLPSQLPRIIWRGGLDLNPLDLSNPLEVKWLESLVWPGQEGRLERLAAAIKIARRHQLDLRRGDLLADMPALLKGAPRDATRTRDMRVADGCD